MDAKDSSTGANGAAIPQTQPATQNLPETIETNNADSEKVVKNDVKNGDVDVIEKHEPQPEANVEIDKSTANDATEIGNLDAEEEIRKENIKTPKASRNVSKPAAASAAASAKVEIVDRKTGLLKDPIKFSQVKLLSIGSMDDVPDNQLAQYHTFKYLYPPGFSTSRMFNGLDNPDVKVEYISSIEKGPHGPIFKITLASNNKVVSEAGVMSGVWMKLIEDINKVRSSMRMPLQGAVTSGPEKYGVADINLMQLLEDNVSGVERCAAMAYQYIHTRSQGPERSRTPKTPKDKSSVIKTPRTPKPAAPKDLPFAPSKSKTAKSEKLKGENGTKIKKLQKAVVYEVNDKVECRFAGADVWYPGVIVEKIDVDFKAGKFWYHIQYEDGDFEENVEDKFIRLRKSEKTPFKILKSSEEIKSVDLEVPNYEIGDKIEGKWRDFPEWYPGIISEVITLGKPNDFGSTIVYGIKYDDGDKETNVDASRIRRIVKKTGIKRKSESANLVEDSGKKSTKKKAEVAIEKPLPTTTKSPKKLMKVEKELESYSPDEVAVVGHLSNLLSGTMKENKKELVVELRSNEINSLTSNNAQLSQHSQEEILKKMKQLFPDWEVYLDQETVRLVFMKPML